MAEENETKKGDGGGATNNNVYIMHKEYAWVPARLLSIEGDKAKVSVPQYKDESSILTDNGNGATGWEEKVISMKGYPGGTFPMQNLDKDDMLDEKADMCDLPFLHEVR
jgi:hypothetical protein